MGTVKRAIFTFAIAGGFIASLLAAPNVGWAKHGDCGQPVSNGTSPATEDCTYSLRAAVFSAQCENCVCDTDGSGALTANDALACLYVADRSSGELSCPVCALQGSSSNGAIPTSTLVPTTTLPETTTTVAQPTTTQTITTTTIPGPQDTCDITFTVNEPIVLGSVQFAVDYAAAPGGFAGGAGLVQCESLVVGGFAAFNDVDAAETLNAGVISLSGFTGPTARCTFEHTEPFPVAPGQFVITVIDAAAPDLTPVSVTVSISSIDCGNEPVCGNGIVEQGEECDLGGNFAGDCCTDQCRIATNGSACDDGLFCTGRDTCRDSGVCVGGSDPCPGSDGDGDCSESCNEASDSCTAPDPGPPCPTPSAGRMTGGGRFYLGTGGKDGLTHALRLTCDPALAPNKLRLVWRKDGERFRFRLGHMDSAVCTDNPAIGPEPPAAGFDTHQGDGHGVLQLGHERQTGATVSWRFTDAGEPNTEDDVSELIVRDGSGNLVLQVAAKLFVGNHQAHAH